MLLREETVEAEDREGEAADTSCVCTKASGGKWERWLGEGVNLSIF